MKSAKNSKKSRRWSLNPATARARTADQVRGQNTDDGLTLVEVMIAFVILMISMVPLGYLLDSTASSAASARQREAAVQLADSWMEVLSNSTPPMLNGSVNLDRWVTPTVPSGAQTPISTLAGTNYTVQAYYSLQSVNNGNGQSDLCSSGQPPSPSHPGVIEMQAVDHRLYEYRLSAAGSPDRRLPGRAGVEQRADRQ
jgi:Tfp pilus assembly protein PilV